MGGRRRGRDVVREGHQRTGGISTWSGCRWWGFFRLAASKHLAWESGRCCNPANVRGWEGIAGGRGFLDRTGGRTCVTRANRYALGLLRCDTAVVISIDRFPQNRPKIVVYVPFDRIGARRPA